MLTLYNSLTKRLEVFHSLEPERVKIHTCGPSIYQLPHIGNYRTFLFEDILHRYIEYLGYNVEREISITDVEDKTIAEAEKEQISVKDLTEGNLNIFIDELKNLRAKIPRHVPRSSTCVDQAVQLIKILLDKGYAYWHKGNIYYDPLKFKGFGKLYGLDLGKWPKTKRRFHMDTYPGNRWNRGDFILWHGYKHGDTVWWNTSIGRGRPSWNIQDPAMAMQHLGLKADICCGGIDNIIRHHDYIIAVIESVTDKPFAHYWLHAAHLYVDGKKMSKSRGNIVYPRELIEQGCHWSHIRFFLIYGHYRKRLNFALLQYFKICKRLDEIRRMIKRLNDYANTGGSTSKSSLKSRNLTSKLQVDFEKKMDDDLHVKDAFDAIFNTISKLIVLKHKRKLSVDDARLAIAKLKVIDQVFQVIF